MENQCELVRVRRGAEEDPCSPKAPLGDRSKSYESKGLVSPIVVIYNSGLNQDLGGPCYANGASVTQTVGSIPDPLAPSEEAGANRWSERPGFVVDTRCPQQPQENREDP